jgi:hypothetical protein
MGGTTRCAVIGKLQRLGLVRAAKDSRGRSAMADSPNQGVKTKALSSDVSPEELLRPRRFTWERADANG